MAAVTTRRLAELQAECDTAGIEYEEFDSREVLMDRLRIKLGAFDATTQLDPMKAEATKGLVTFGPDGPCYDGLAHLLTEAFAAEPKLDGVRMRMAVGLTGSTLNSGRRSVKDYSYTSRTANFPHLAEVAHADLAGVILDGELLAPTSRLTTASGVQTNSLLNSSVALVNCGPEKSISVQEKFGKAQFWVFDVMSGPGGAAVQHLPYTERRAILEQVVELVQLEYPACEIRLVQQMPATVESILLALELGFEGVVLKRLDSPYLCGKRKGWHKVKLGATADAFIVGFNPGDNRHLGKVGSLEVAVMAADGTVRGVAAVGNLTDELRDEVTDPATGGVKAEWMGRVVEFYAQGLGKNGRARHACLVRLRPDKDELDCDEAQLDNFTAM